MRAGFQELGYCFLLVGRLWENIAEASTTDIVNYFICDEKRIPEGGSSYCSDIGARSREARTELVSS